MDREKLTFTAYHKTSGEIRVVGSATGVQNHHQALKLLADSVDSIRRKFNESDYSMFTFHEGMPENNITDIDLPPLRSSLELVLTGLLIGYAER